MIAAKHSGGSVRKRGLHGEKKRGGEGEKNNEEREGRLRKKQRGCINESKFHRTKGGDEESILNEYKNRPSKDQRENLISSSPRPYHPAQ